MSKKTTESIPIAPQPWPPVKPKSQTSRTKVRLITATAALALIAMLSIGGNAASISFLDSVRAFFGFETATQTTEFVAPTQPAVPMITAGGSLTTFGGPLVDNFDSLQNTGTGHTWTDDTTLLGGYSNRATYSASTGSATTGGLYSYGNPAGALERALGSVASATAVPIYGFKLTNNIGATIGSLNVIYTGEQWRNSGESAQVLAFEYQVADPGTITDIDTPSSGWLPVSALDFTSPVTGGTAGAIDGNLVGNRTLFSQTFVLASPAPNGKEIWVRWRDTNDANDDHGLAIDDVSISANANSNPPTISDIADSSTNEDTSTGPINFTITDEQLGTVTLTGSSSNLTLVPNGNITFGGSGGSRTVSVMPAPNLSGTATITVTVEDEDDQVASDSFVLTVTAVNDPPVATDDSMTTNEDNAVSTPNVLANDTDGGDGGTLQVTANTQGANGSVSCTLAGVCTYTPNLNFNGSDSFDYTVSDGTDTDTGTVSVTITAVNDPPVATDDSMTTNEDNAVSTPNVLANDTDGGDGGTLQVTANTQGANGSVSCTLAGVCTYTPNLNFNGSDSFDYTVSDGTDTDTGTVSVTITAVNDPPVATDDSMTTNEDNAVSTPNVLANDTDGGDGGTLQVTANTQGANGSVSCTLAGVCTYTPNLNFNGSDSFDYTVSDGTDTDTGTVSVTITAVNDPPVATDDSMTTNEDNAVSTPNVLANDTDGGDGGTLQVTANTQGANGSVSCTLAGVCTYTPNLNFNGSDSFDYTVSDGTDTDTGTVSVTITAVNDPPVATDDSMTTNEDNAVSTPNVLANDTDGGDGGTLQVTANTQGANGSVSCTLAGVCTYTPNLNFNGSDSFDYTVSDGTDTDTGTVSVTITAVNDPPVATDDSMTTNEDNAVSTPNVLANDTDGGDGGTLQVTANTQGANGSVSCTLAGVCTYTPNLNFNGSDSFDYTVSDGTDTDTGTVSVTITAVNDPPVATDDSMTTNEDNAVSTPNVLANDTDGGDGGTLQVTANTQGANGSVSCTLAGVCTYTPNLNFNGSDSFDYTVSDGTDTDTGTVSVTITAVNDPPVATDDSMTTNEDNAVSTPNVLANDTDGGDGGTLQVTANTQGANGSVSCTLAGVCTYTPNLNFNGSDSFDYTVSDGTDTDTGTVSVTITAVNDPPVATDDSMTTNEDNAVSTPNVLANDTDGGDGGTLQVTANTQGANGSVSCTLAGVCTYTPNLNFNGSDSFDYTVSDGTDTDTGTVNVTVTAVNDDPTASNGSATTNEDIAVIVTLIGSDIDDDGLTFAIGTGPSNGALGSISTPDCSAANVCTADVTYTPTANYNGPDSFTFTVNDGTSTSSPATVSITVTAVNDEPTLNAIPNLIMYKNQTKVLNLAGITVGPLNEVGQTLTVASASTGTGGDPVSLGTSVTYTSPNATGTLSITPVLNDIGTATVTVTVTDNGSNTPPNDNTFSRTFTVEVRDCLTVSIPDNLTAPQGTELWIPVSIGPDDIAPANIQGINFQINYNPAKLEPVFSVTPPSPNVVYGEGYIDLDDSANAGANPWIVTVAKSPSADRINVVMNPPGSFTPSGTGVVIRVRMKVKITPPDGPTGTSLDLDNVVLNDDVCAFADDGSFIVQIGATTTTVVSDNSPTVYGTNAMFTATVAGPTAPNEGSVKFTIAGTDVPTCLTQPVTVVPATNTVTATCSINYLNVLPGPHTVEASYTGAGNYSNSSSPAPPLAPTHTVTPATVECETNTPNQITGIDEDYDGTPYSPTGGCTGVLGQFFDSVAEGLTFTPSSRTNPTVPPGATDSWTFNGSAAGVGAPNGNYFNDNGTILNTIHSGTVSGRVLLAVQLEKAVPAIVGIPNVEVDADQTSLPGTLDFMVNTNNTLAADYGKYVLSNFSMMPFSSAFFGAGAYSVTPSKAMQPCSYLPGSTDPPNGISSADASAVSRHIAELAPLTGSALLAADVSNNNVISAFDAGLIARKVVGICVPPNVAGEWRFIAIPGSPGGTANGASTDYTSLIDQTYIDQNFKGYLMGDVNGSWNPDQTDTLPDRPTPADPNSPVASLPRVSGMPGGIITVPLSINSLKGRGIEAYQFDVEYDPEVVEPMISAGSQAVDLGGTMGQEFSVVSNVVRPGLIKVAVYGAATALGDGVYANLRFSAKGGLGSVSMLRIEGFRFNDGSVGVNTIDGSISLSQASTGDVISGRVLIPGGQSGLRNARVTLTSDTGETFTATTGTFGYFQFGELTMGRTYTVAVQSRRFRFTPVTVALTDNLAPIDLIGQE